AEPDERVDLLVETLAHGGLGASGAKAHALDRDLAVDVAVARSHDLAEAARAEGPEDLVALEEAGGVAGRLRLGVGSEGEEAPVEDPPAELLVTHRTSTPANDGG